MDSKPASVEKKIILATIDCIEKYGLAGATNRQIASLTGVNNAAINYYFRSKEILIERCMEITLKNAFDLGDMPPMPGLPAQERCVAILQDLVQGGFRYPGITRAHFNQLLVEGKIDSRLQQRLNQFIVDLALDLQARGCSLPSDDLKLDLVQIISAVILAILAPHLFAGQPGIDLQDPAACQAYLTRLVGRLLV